MIKSFRHKGLQLFFNTGKTSGINSSHAKRLRDLLTALDTAIDIQDMNITGYDLHPLKGNRKGFWSIKVNANWRLTFSLQQSDVENVNYEDYHS